ncbi:MAG: ribbon-helix-helix protein, CopG family [Chromatiaceae bacterium]|nr:ribbon-helix-helix protein, CopG family [Chromatiaceae bacterium]
MARTSKNLGFTVPPRMAEEFERVAAEEGSTKSELFRRMFRLYQSYRAPRQAADPQGWAERLILEAKQTEQLKPLTEAEFQTELEQAVRYGAKRAEALGLTEEALNEQLHDGARTRS